MSNQHAMDPRDLPEAIADVADLYKRMSPEMFCGIMGDQSSVAWDGLVYDRTDEAMLDLYNMSSGSFVPFYVTKDMTEKAIEASKTMPNWLISTDDVPAMNGFMYLEGLEMSPWDGGKRKRVSSALSWAVTQLDGASIFEIGYYIDFRSGLEFPRKTSMRAGMKSLRIGSRLVLTSFVPWLIGDKADGVPDMEPMETMALLKTIWLMMRQNEIVDSSEIEPSRNSAKRIRRQGLDPRSVRIVDIRRRRYASQGREQYAREYDHRWKVRGHWRNQWYPSRGVHRPKWIEEHVRGPEDAPLIERDTVYRLK